MADGQRSKPGWIEKADNGQFDVFNVINGARQACLSGDPVEKFAARNGRKIAEFGSGTTEDADAAVGAAKAAFEQGTWSRISVYKRKAILLKLADLVDQKQQEFALLESLDTGKPIANARADISTVSGTLRAAAHDAVNVCGPSALDGDCFSFQLRKPVGVCAAIVGWNYPLVLAAQKIGPALAMGNTLVIKPSEFTSLSLWKLAELALEAGVPEGVLNVVNGIGSTVGDALARHPDVRLLSFTGSTATGKTLIMRAGQSNMKRLILECGGKSPFIIFDDYEGDLDQLAKYMLINSSFRNQGALCVSSSRILIQAGIRKKLLPKLIEVTESILPADPLLEETRFGAIMNAPHLAKVEAYIESGREDGANFLTATGRVLEESGGYYLKPCLYEGVDPSARIAREEIFGPVAGIFTFETEDEAIALANDTEYGLAAQVATSNGARQHRLARALEVASLTMFSTLEAEGAGIVFGLQPHKQSGFGFEHGLAGLEAWTASTHALVI